MAMYSDVSQSAPGPKKGKGGYKGKGKLDRRVVYEILDDLMEEPSVRRYPLAKKHSVSAQTVMRIANASFAMAWLKDDPKWQEFDNLRKRGLRKPGTAIPPVGPQVVSARGDGVVMVPHDDRPQALFTPPLLALRPPTYATRAPAPTPKMIPVPTESVVFPPVGDPEPTPEPIGDADTIEALEASSDPDDQEEAEYLRRLHNDHGGWALRPNPTRVIEVGEPEAEADAEVGPEPEEVEEPSFDLVGLGDGIMATSVLTEPEPEEVLAFDIEIEQQVIAVIPITPVTVDPRLIESARTLVEVVGAQSLGLVPRVKWDRVVTLLGEAHAGLSMATEALGELIAFVNEEEKSNNGN